jgi:hypothetical protein
MFNKKQEKINLPALVKFLRENGINKYEGAGLSIEFFPQALFKQPMVDNTIATEAKKQDVDPLEDDFKDFQIVRVNNNGGSN